MRVNTLTARKCKFPDMKRMTLAERALFAREQAGYENPGKAADDIGCARTTVIAWEDGSAKSFGSFLLAAARAYRVRSDWLATGEGEHGFPWSEPSDAPPSDDDRWTDVRGYAQAVGLGDGAEAEEYEVTHALKFRRDSLARKRLSAQRLAVVYGRGDSMLPRIKSGDAVLFDTSDTSPSHGDLFVIRVDGSANSEYNVKRCEIVDDLVLFKADNPSGDHQWRMAKRMDSKKHPISIIGRVRWIGSWED